MFKGDFEVVLEGDLEGYLEGYLKGDLEEDLEGDSKGNYRCDFKEDLEDDLLSSSGLIQVVVQVWFSLQLKFNSLELDSEVGRLFFVYHFVFHVSKFDIDNLKCFSGTKV